MPPPTAFELALEKLYSEPDEVTDNAPSAANELNSEQLNLLQLFGEAKKHKVVVTTQAGDPFQDKQILKRQAERIKARKQEDLSEWQKLYLAHETLLENCTELRCSSIAKIVHERVRDKSVVQFADGQPDFFALNKSNYLKPLLTLLLANEVHEAIDMRKYDLAGATVEKIADPTRRQPYLLEVRLPGLSKGQPAIIPSDQVVLEKDRQYEVFDIVDIDGDLVRFKRNQLRFQQFQNRVSTFSESIVWPQQFNVSFVSSGLPYKRYHNALRMTDGNSYFQNLLFESPTVQETGDTTSCEGLTCERVNIVETTTPELDRRLALCNPRQRQAIRGILGARCRPKPYILFGPPGTGKTFTLVEAIIQVYIRRPLCKILVCANSNNCADQLARSINATELVHVSTMKRFNSRNYFAKKPCRFTYDTVEKKELLDSRLVISTNNTAAALNERMKFDYVFVDEAGHAHEPESLIPTVNLHSDGLLVLAGDPKQLGPVIRCHEVEQLGLGESLLERLFKFKVYERNVKHETYYDPNYITKLTISYRCDPRILEVCDKLFYEGDLECLGKCPDSLLNDLKFSYPLVFHSIVGRESRIETSTSRCNIMEAELCVDYVIKLYNNGIDADKIGVITPYKLQREEVREKLAQKLESYRLASKMEQLSVTMKDETRGEQTSDNNDTNNNPSELNEEARKKDLMKYRMCQVDTVDAFQGQEKEIIIISTVRTPNEFGLIEQSRFIIDSRRFNVAISRAKWLVIVVGHPTVLDCHKNWREFRKLASIIHHPV